jgi:hypothetical protein
LVVTGPESEVRRFREKVIRSREEDGQDYFDFEAVVPMPDRVRNPRIRANTRLAVECVGYGVRYYLLSSDVEQCFLPAQVLSPEALRGREDRMGRAEFPFFDESMWSRVNWGTPYPASDFSWVSQAPDRLDFQFATAFHSPMPIFDKLASEFPALTIDVTFYIGDFDLAGRGVIAGGSNNIVGVELTEELESYVDGCPPSEDEEE